MADGKGTASGEQLIARAQENPQALAELYERHYDAVFRYCVHRLFDRSAAEDVTSTVFLKVVQNLHRFQGNGRDFGNWLYTIATNAANDYLRKARRRRKLLEQVGRRAEREGASVQSESEQTARRVVRLKRSLLALRKRYQAIIALRFFEGMSHDQIAAVLGGSPATVRSQLSRALAALRKRMRSAAEDRLEET